MTPWTPPRRRGVEILDNPNTPPGIRERAMADVARSNKLFGGTRAMLGALYAVLPLLPRQATMLDVGTGTGDIPARALDTARRRGVELTTIGLDESEDILRSARRAVTTTVAGDVLRLPLADHSADLVTCSQLLHHFADEDAHAVVAELHRVARIAVIIADIRRSRIAAAAFAIAGTALGFHPVTRLDGVTSVYRGFTATELRGLVESVTGRTPHVRRDAFWRLTVWWSKERSS
jgi:ubiquinone/menaquinone biosynthesis C-methylase UbiE